MMEKDQNRTVGDSPTSTVSPPDVGYSSPPPRLRRRRSLPYWGVALLTVAILGGGYLALTGTTPTDTSLSDEEEQGLPPGDKWAQNYEKWDPPLLALVLTGQMHGYIDPCGCSSPQYGGLVRRYNFIESLRSGTDKRKGWQVLGIDLGELPQLQGIHLQSMLKYDLSLRALAVMNYRAIGVGKNEVLSPLGEALAQAYDKDKPMPRPLALSLAQTAPGQTYHDLNVRPYEIVKETTPKVGIISMMGPDMREMLKNKETFLNNAEELPRALHAMGAAGVEFGIILHHEYPQVDDAIFGIKRMQEVENKRKEMALMCAKFCAEQRKKNPKIPPILLMMILTDEPEPPSTIKLLDPALPTRVVEIGHKGKYVGLAGIYKEGHGYRVQYQIISMGPEWQTRKGKEEKQPVIALMETYYQELKRVNMLNKFPRTLHYNQIPAPDQKGLKATFVGSEACNKCHPHAYNVWSNTSHFKATATLEEMKHPSGRQYDPECMMCHTVGFKHPGGYHDPMDPALWPKKGAQPADAAVLKAHNEGLRGVGCESCHGPASEHVKRPGNTAIRALLNPYGPTAAERKLAAQVKAAGNPELQAALKKMTERRMQGLEQFCTKCHDHDNDVQWGKPGRDIVDNWAKIIHATPPEKIVENPPAGNPPAGNPPAGNTNLQTPVNLGNPLIPESAPDGELHKK